MSISVALAGSGGAGVITVGRMLLEAAGTLGWYGCMTRSTGPQIRGGESAAMVRLDTVPVGSHDDRFAALLAIDWRNIERFAGDIPLDGDSVILGEADGEEPPEGLPGTGARLVRLPFKALAKEFTGGRPNMVALGVLAALTGLPAEACEAVLARSLRAKGEAALAAGAACLHAGYGAARECGLSLFGDVSPPGGKRWSMTGNQACGLGALRGGIRFVAAYPITPATEVLEWLAPALPRVGGALVQAEDELAAINQIIGASFGGAPSLTATSGPGLALMSESLGLAVASETPVVVVNVMRGGPSTGMPTKSEQSDLDLALHGLHGDAPHLVLAPTSVSDCVFTTQWAVHLAEGLQTAAIVLSDQSLGQTQALVEPQADIGLRAQRCRPGPGADDGPYARYRVTEDGISPMAEPGMAGYQYTADGLTHDAEGTPSSQADHHIEQLDKRRRKLEQYAFGPAWAELEGAGETAVVTWGSSTGPVREALARLASEGYPVRLVAIRVLAPVQTEAFAAALEDVARMLVVEQSAGGQFLRYLRGYALVPAHAEIRALSLPGPLPLRPGVIAAALRDWASQQAPP